ncbi:cysteine--tRNA ligase [Humibacillus sp. DSM 29435]|uniref:cysteine--tRNA ligase n=1 Tax=Humibacillus sp. DSM 29435 TaxID=1869167 RepID=UPI0008725C94|nr:cysteine--tRNA ligase [Humibacillus sp. DSM 29435]OFE15859.1 cysteine--tRNA ligase [Humibacillus sp. DSM 29435]
MTLQLFDTSAREQRDFTPREPGRVGIYICGLTTQGEPHIGHIRFAVAFDVLRRWLEVGHGFEVTLVRNVTDIDDKVLRKAAEAGEPWFALTYRNERHTAAALDALGVLPATYEPRATRHVPDMVALMETLIEKGHAYAAPDGSGDVYFDVRSWPDYGSLSNQSIDDMANADDADPRGKRDPRDFALWKGRKPAEPESASWPTPFGPGRPGWHLECSAMARRWLGDEFDIHGGGIDLRFPHHENEQAQSRAAGLGFARYWLHNAWVTVKGEKMGKSLGNALAVRELLKTTRPIALRYYLTAAHYRSMIEYHEGSLEEAASAVERIEGFLERASRRGEIARFAGAGSDTHGLDAGGPALAPPFPAEFVASMNDDLGVSGALAVIHDTVRAGNIALDDGDDEAALDAAAAVVAMTDVLGVNPLAEHWHHEGDAGAMAAQEALDALVRGQLDARQAARQERDFDRADAIRDQLAAVGIEITDTPSGARWALARRSSTDTSSPNSKD